MNLSVDFLSRLRCCLISSHSAVKAKAGDNAAEAAGFPGAFVEVEYSVNAIVTKIDELTRGTARECSGSSTAPPSAGRSPPIPR